MKIYVGGLPYEATESVVREMFESYGTVSSANIIMDRDTGRSKGFGFVEMADEAGRKAISELNEAELGGRTLIVNEARPQTKGFGGGGNRGGGYGGGSRGGYGGGGNRGGYGGGSRY